MTFDNPEIEVLDILRRKPNGKLIEDAAAANKKLRMHLYGDKLDVQLRTITGFESATLHKLRTDYARSNMDLFCRLGEPMLEVFTARGGSINYNLPEARKANAQTLTDDIYGGYALKKWMETFWLTHYKDDPNGLILIEVAEASEIASLKKQNKPLAYPCYKDINCIVDYKVTGNKLEYIIFTVSKEEAIKQRLDPALTYYRVIDDTFDYYFQYGDSKLTRVENATYFNIFGHVPARLCSDIPDSKINGLMISPFYYIMELADHFLVKGSLKVTHDFRHAFPKYWEYADNCPVCNGTKYDGAEPCKACKGSGKKMMLHVSDVKLVDYPQDKDTPTVTPNVAGYVSPDKVFWEISTSDIADLEVLMKYTCWGIDSSARTTGPNASNTSLNPSTATEALLNSKPKANKLMTISTSAETMHKFILDHIIIATLDSRYNGASVNYGRRYNLEGPDEVWKKYSDARNAGAPISALTDLLLEYYAVKYSEDPVTLNNMEKLMKVEPFLHFDTSELKALGATPEDYMQKLYYGEWLATKSSADILIMAVPELKADLIKFSATKVIKVEPLPGAAAPAPGAKPVPAGGGADPNSTEDVIQ